MEGERVMKIQEQDKWMTPIIRYLKEGQLQKIGIKHGRYKSELLASSLLMMPYTDKDIPSPSLMC